MALAANLMNDQPVQLTQPRIVGGGGGGGPRLLPGNNGGQVAALPVPPQAQIVAAYAGHTTVAPPNLNGAAGVPARQDINWTTNVAVIPKSLADDWNTDFGPAKPGGQPRVNNPNTQILFVKVLREEKSFEGKWSNDVVVKQFEFSQLIPPPAANDLNKQRQYILWAGRNIAEIANPPFAPRADGFAGTIWKDPKVILQSLVKTTPTKSAEIPEADEFEFTVIPTQAGPPGGIGTPGRLGGPPQRPAQPKKTTNVPPPAPKPSAVPESLDPVVSADKNYHPTSMPSAMPAALFNPAAAAPPADMMFDFHDDTVQAGHTYRYKVEYTLLNPVFDKPNLVANPDLAKKFGLVSPVSDFGPEITVPPTSIFFCAKNFGLNDQKFIFDVFAWSDGKWHAHKFIVNPGDSIGQMTQDGTANVDFATRYSYVESGHGVDNKSLATVVSDDGLIQIRDTSKELDSDDHHKYQHWVDNPSNGDSNPNVASAPPGPAGPAGQNGAPGGVGGAPPGMFHPPGAPPGVFVPVPPPEDNN
jgi:hypothetical protein